MSISSGKTVDNRTHFEAVGRGEVVLSGYRIIGEYVDLACTVHSVNIVR